MLSGELFWTLFTSTGCGHLIFQFKELFCLESLISPCLNDRIFIRSLEHFPNSESVHLFVKGECILSQTEISLAKDQASVIL